MTRRDAAARKGRPARAAPHAHAPGADGARPPVPLTIAGHDPSGGAGLGADLKVFLRFGLSGMAVPTALTVQTAAGVRDVGGLSGGQVAAQLAPLLAAGDPAAVKVGLLPSAEVVRAVAAALAPLAGRVPIVLDPVLASGSGTRLLPPEDVPVLLAELLPLVTLLTPNLDEAAELLGLDAVEPGAAALALRRHGPAAVLLKGGHAAGRDAVDLLATADSRVSFALPRLPLPRRVHGTGCALSAAITALLAQQVPLEDAVGLAKAYVHAAIAGALPAGEAVALLDFAADFGEE